ncbi:MAG TPA: hypothetical protein VEM35_02705 [Rhizomicrobium sp.]|nr:hypothetical protein [Rhizomicrobium sp.]
MIRRIPIVATIRDSYTFATTHLGGVIGLIWVPMVLATVMGFFSFQRYYNDFIDAMAGGNVAALGPSLLMMLGYLVAALLLYAVMFVAVVQLALGARSAPAVAHFAFGHLEWRMFRAFLAFIGVILVLVLPAFIAANAVLTMAGARLPQTVSSILLMLVFYGVVLLAMPRFFVLLPSIAVAESAPVLRRAWTLSAGNFWRLLAVLLAIFGPILVLFTVLEMVLAGRAPALATGSTEQVILLAAIVRAREVLPLISGLGFLISPLVVGLFAGASVSVWRSLKDEPGIDIAV